MKMVELMSASDEMSVLRVRTNHRQIFFGVTFFLADQYLNQAVCVSLPGVYGLVNCVGYFLGGAQLHEMHAVVLIQIKRFNLILGANLFDCLVRVHISFRFALFVEVVLSVGVHIVLLLRAQMSLQLDFGNIMFCIVYGSDLGNIGAEIVDV